ncbi:hypothetical protein [Pedobacter sp. MW01-1-1]|uniref:hypothetical protein n=1 Tax=Pedobacter sp. MW01-1-1 TaxID=3383027 RepID=UPI003FEF1B76
MYKRINYITALLAFVSVLSVKAQVTTESPYSRYGLGNIKGSLLPNLRAMGGISTAVNKVTGFNYINMQNPASYSSINLTTADIGIAGEITNLSKGSQQESSFNGSFGHIAFGIPISKRSAMSFGLLPYSEVGYSYSNPTKVDTTNIKEIYQGEGGLTKAYFGYGIRIGNHFRIGANAEYIFGNIINTKAIEYYDVAAYNAKLQNKNSVGGFSFSYGAQYDFNISKKTLVTLGYSGSNKAKVNSWQSFYATQYTLNSNGEENPALDTLSAIVNGKSSLVLPLVHNFGIAIQENDKWLVGADFRMGKWAGTTINGVNQGLQDSWGVAVGAQFTPDYTSYNNYFARVDYRLGVNYDKTYIKIGTNDINQRSASFGFGFPLAASRGGATFYKINFTTVIGDRGTLANNLVKERFVNFYLGFTLNDTWFRKYRLD